MENQNLEQEPQIEQEHNPMLEEKLVENNKNWILIITSIVLVLLTISGGAYWWLLKNQVTEQGPVIINELENDVINNDDRLEEEQGPSNDKKQHSKNTGLLVINNAGIEHIITAKDVDILEDYSGAVWSEDSEKVYFIKYVEIDLNKEMEDALEQEAFNQLEEMSEPFNNGDVSYEEVMEMMDNLPAAYHSEDLFREVQIFEYNIIDDEINFIGNFDYDPDGYPVRFFVSTNIIDNNIKFGDGSIIYRINIDSGEISEQPGPPPGRDNGMLVIMESEDSIFGPTRYISPNSHGYFEMSPTFALDYNNDDELIYFYDDSMILRSGEDSYKSDKNIYFAGSIISDPDNILNNTLLRSPEEIEFRKKLVN